jgi:hypothetical protein
MNKIDIPRDVLFDLCITQKLNNTQIASVVGCDPNTVAHKLEKYNIKKIRSRNKLYNDLSGKRFGKLLVISFSHKETIKKKIVWNCKCDCGNECKIRSSYLQAKRCPARSCGCGLQRKRLPPNKYFPPNLFSRICTSAKRRKYELNITIEYLWNLFNDQNKKCIFTGLELSLGDSQCRGRTASLDRIDGSKGYIIGNVQWVHKDINMMKQKMSDNQFIYMCSLVARYRDV